MAEEKNTMPELTLTPNDTAAAAAQAVPELTLDPTAPAAPDVQEAPKPASGGTSTGIWTWRRPRLLPGPW